MTIATFTIGNITISNNYPAIDIVENFYASATERKTLYTVMPISKGVYTFVGANDWDAFYNDIFTNGTFASAQAASETAFDLAVKTATELEAAFNVTADAANAILHTAIAVEADLQNEANEVAGIFAELDLVPENACEDIALEALIAGSAFDNAEPTPAFSLHYEMPTNLYDLDELSNVIAEEEWRALGAVDAEISAVKAKLIELNDKRIGIVEECAHWRGKCDRAIEIAEYEASYEANEADADLRQSIWLSTGQDIM